MGKLLVKKLDPSAKLPIVAHPGEDLGYDIFALEDTFLEPFHPVKIRTGIAATFIGDPVVEPNPVYGPGGAATRIPKFGLEIEDRSGMAANNHVHILAGKVDAGYRDEIRVVMVLLGQGKHIHPESIARLGEFGLSESEWMTVPESFREYVGARMEFKKGYRIQAGDKIAQLLPRRIYSAGVVEVEELPENGVRGLNGFGSTGI
jgi:dUTP pyrophosphatase